ncbi:MAG: hypothetical protein AAGE52_41530 [Myxococcota bacterium]
MNEARDGGVFARLLSVVRGGPDGPATPKRVRGDHVYLGGPDLGSARHLVLALHDYGETKSQLRKELPMPKAAGYFALPAPYRVKNRVGFSYFNHHPHAPSEAQLEAAVDRLETSVQYLHDYAQQLTLVGYGQGAAVVLHALLTRSLPIDGAAVLGNAKPVVSRGRVTCNANIFLATGPSEADAIRSARLRLTLEASEYRVFEHRELPNASSRTTLRALHRWIRATQGRRTSGFRLKTK